MVDDPPTPRSGPAPAPVAVVTGAGGGIGSAVARRLHADGFQVACVDREGARARAGSAGLPRSAPFTCDVAVAAEVARLRDAVTGRLGTPSLLVNAAGVFFTHRVPELEEGDYDRILDVNLKGTFLTCRAFLPAMTAAGHGCIINIASTAGLRGGRDRAAYCASKAGVVMLTRSLALDHGREGVRINCVCPGLIDTPMADWITSRPDDLERWRAAVPAQRIGTPDDVAGTVSFLASADAAYVQGAVLLVDGGVSA